MPDHTIRHEDWDEHFASSRRQSRQERKLRSAKDRSKYKKTDRVKRDENRERGQEEALKLLEEAPETTKKGRVRLIQSHEFHLIIDGKEAIARLRGTLKLAEEREKNLIIVGDEVVAVLEQDGTWSVEAVLPRKSILCRQDNLHRIKRHLIAANVDQVFITVSVGNPHLRPAIIDRYLIAAMTGGIRPILLINKLDLLDEVTEGERELFDHVCQLYPAVGVPVLTFSVVTSEGVEALQNAMKGYISVFSGQSGTGKSSIINALLGTVLKVGETVDRTRKGAHTTTFAQIIPIPPSGMCIDTPGIRSFGIWDITKDDVRNGFIEFHKCRTPCQFSNCWHRDEIGCGVLHELEQEESCVSPIRYQSYLSLLEEIEGEHKRR